MPRRNEILDPDVARELDELERALNDDPTADPVLLALVGDVRAATPAPDLGFAARLDEQVAQDFPRERSRWAALGTKVLDGPRSMLPAMAVASCLVIGAVVIGAGSIGGGDDDMDSAGSSGGNVALSESAEDSAVGGGASSEPVAPAARQSAPSPSAGAVPESSVLARPKAVSPLVAAPDPDAIPGRRARKVQRGAQLTLTTSADDVQKVSDGVVRETQAVGGIVASSQVSTSESGGTGTFTLRIPSDKLDEAIKRLSKLANVGSLSQDQTDITGSFVSVEERLGDARSERKALLRALGRAQTATQIASLKRRIAINRSEIAGLKGELNSLRRRADLATVTVSVEGSGEAKDPDEGGAWTPGDAAGDALRILEVAAGVILVGLAVLAPLALLGGLAAVAARASRRRRRETALDAA